MDAELALFQQEMLKLTAPAAAPSAATALAATTAAPPQLAAPPKPVPAAVCAVCLARRAFAGAARC